MASWSFARTASGPPDQWRRPGWRAALIAAVALTATGCGGMSPSQSAPSPLPKTTLAACTVGGLAADCGNVRVPQDWAHPAGPTMPLRVVVLPATGTSHPAPPLFYLAGYNGDSAGFGDAVLNGLDWAASAFRQLNQTMDMVFIEQRGTAGSGLQTCPGLQPESTTLNFAAISAAARRCLASASRDPRHDTTTSAVRDLDQVRQALGYHRINIYGPSYGVTIGLAYLQRYSSHVRTAVLDSGSLLSVPLWQLSAVHDQQAFDQLASRCAAAPACARSYHPAADLAAILGRLNTRPVQVTLPGPGDQHKTVTITTVAFLSFVSDYLGEAQTAVQLPAVLHALARGQWSQVVARLGLTTASLSGGPTALQAVTIECSDAWAAMNPATVGRQGPSAFAPLVTAQAERLHALCSSWPHDPGVSGAVRSAVPVVFLNGTADVADPPANVAAAAATMPNALLVSVPGTGHWILANATSSGCLLAAATAFIQAGRPASAGSWNACTRAIPREPVPFPGGDGAQVLGSGMAAATTLRVSGTGFSIPFSGPSRYEYLAPSYGLFVNTHGQLESPANTDAPTRQINTLIAPGGYLGKCMRANGATRSLIMLYRSPHPVEAAYGFVAQQQSGAAQLVTNTKAGASVEVGMSMVPALWLVNFILIYIYIY